MSDEEAAIIEPTANVVQDVLERGRVEPNDTVVVIGPGAIGLLSVMAVRAAGANKVIVVGTTNDLSFRLKVAKEIGADEVVLADQEDAVEAVKQMTNGRGADLVVEASGAPQAIASTVWNGPQNGENYANRFVRENLNILSLGCCLVEGVYHFFNLSTGVYLLG